MSFNKQEQMLRAAQVNAANAAQGVKPPSLPMPITTPVVKVPRDKRGQQIKLYDVVVRAVGRTADLQICKVTKIDGLKVYLDNSKQALIYNDRIVVL